MVIDLVHIEA